MSETTETTIRGSVMSHMLGAEPHKVFYGANAIRGFARLFVQEHDTLPDGQQMHSIAGALMTED
jgi:hypothetical protein